MGETAVLVVESVNSSFSQWFTGKHSCCILPIVMHEYLNVFYACFVFCTKAKALLTICSLISGMHSLLKSIHVGLAKTLGETAEPKWLRKLPGGDINQAALISSGGRNYFLKYHPHASMDMFAAEAQALKDISELGCIRVPAPIVFGKDGNTSWLLLEHLELTSTGPAAQLGEQLAALHSVDFNHYGWTRDNYIGTTPQCNTVTASWSQFWRECRLQPQFAMAYAGGFGRRLSDNAEKLLESMDQLMDGHQPCASLLHGDLWAGNKAFTRRGQAVIFDPASYHGDRETDIAMTELFGGFETDFYSAYRAHSPLPDGYQLRRDLYNLYHMLNHLNLFGEAYLSRCENMIGGLLAQIH
jgi:fructosamine-3-kinase